MKVRDLINKMETTNQNATVFIATTHGVYDFNGVSIDDERNVVLYIEPDDRKS